MSPPTSTRRLLIAIVCLIALIVIGVIVRATLGSHQPPGHEGADETTFPTPSTTTTPLIAPPPGVAPSNTNAASSTETASSSAASTAPTATPDAERSLNRLASITDPQQWAEQFGVVWNSFVPVGNRADQWIANVSNYSTGPCQTLLSDDGGAPWAQAMMSQMAVTPTSTPRAQQLWEIGDASMWRVSTTISMRSIDPAYRQLDGTSSTVWDFYLKRQSDGTFLLDSYALAAPENADPHTYTPAR